MQVVSCLQTIISRTSCDSLTGYTPDHPCVDRLAAVDGASTTEAHNDIASGVNRTAECPFDQRGRGLARHSRGLPAADGSTGQCQKCHLRHEFSLEQARKPETCNFCHIGPDHPQWEIYQESPHGIAYATGGDDWNWEAEPGTLVIQFEDAIPQLDGSVPFRSRRVRSLTTRDTSIVISLASGIGLQSWHPIEAPPRVTIELGPQRRTPTPAPVRGPVTSQLGPRPVVIDPGHGGDDNGASSPSGLTEKEVTLAVARRLARTLEGRGHAVRLTRDGDQGRVLSDRTALANRLDANNSNR